MTGAVDNNLDYGTNELLTGIADNNLNAPSATPTVKFEDAVYIFSHPFYF